MAPLTIREQDRLIRQAWPALRTVMVGKRLGIWRGPVQGLSQIYEVEILYARNRDTDLFKFAQAWFPEVKVLDPPLRFREDDPEDPIPHIYWTEQGDPDCLCLFYPRERGWTKAMPIAETTLPWTASWLRFYEAWHATGTWYGGGASHGRVARNDSSPEREDALPARQGERIDRRDDLLRGASEEVLITQVLWQERFREWSAEAAALSLGLAA